MASEAPIKLPLIDFSNFYMNEATIPDDWNSVKIQVLQALIEYGIFRASMAGMSPEFRSSLFGSMDQLFDLPLETKQKRISDKPLHGYISPSPNMPLYESMAIPDTQLAGEVEEFTNFFWPKGNFGFRQNIWNITNKLYWCDQIVRKIIMESLGVEKYLDDHMDNKKHLLRVSKYRGPETDKSITEVMSHVDHTTLAILLQNDVAGLEFQTRSGEWSKVEQPPDSFTVIAGEAWSNGRLHAPHHRVMMTGNETRYSIGLFSVPKPGYITRVPDELVNEEHPLLVNPFDYDEYLEHSFAGKVDADEDAAGAYIHVKETLVTTFANSGSK